MSKDTEENEMEEYPLFDSSSPFPTTYLLEARFPSYVLTKATYCKRLSAEADKSSQLSL